MGTDRSTSTRCRGPDLSIRMAFQRYNVAGPRSFRCASVSVVRSPLEAPGYRHGTLIQAARSRPVRAARAAAADSRVRGECPTDFVFCRSKVPICRGSPVIPRSRDCSHRIGTCLRENWSTTCRTLELRKAGPRRRLRGGDRCRCSVIRRCAAIGRGSFDLPLDKGLYHCRTGLHQDQKAP